MPIELGNVPWPPADVAQERRYWRSWGSWYSGDPEQLAAVYGASSPVVPDLRYTNGKSGYLAQPQQSGGIVGMVQRWFWGRTPSATQATTRMHLPAASDVSALSADLLYGEPPAFALPDSEVSKTDAAGTVLSVANPAQEWLDDALADGGVYSTLLESAELSSAYGGVYLRACADVTISDYPIVEALPVDVGVPEWRYGVMTAVTFWRVVQESEGKVWRHLERHEVIGGVSMIFHALYVGDAEKLGLQWPLDAHPETARFAALVDVNGGIVTGASKLDVVFIPNVRPHRLIRGTPHGRSDYAGAESAMDGLDEVWSSLMRDIRLAKARLVVPSGYLKSGGRGRGATFDVEQEVFVGLETMGDPSQAMSLEQVQFAIRDAQHLNVAAGHWRTIMRAAGLSADAFGEEIDGGAATAKEIGRRGERTTGTRARKIGYARRPLAHLSFVIQELGVAHYGARLTPTPAELEWPDGASIDPETQARTLQLLDAAGAVSTREKVRMLHPDWSEPDIDAEVDLIEGEAAPDPTLFDGMGVDPSAPPMPMNTPPAEPARAGAGATK